MSAVESDEAFARRLQAQEMGIMLNITHNDAQTPLMHQEPRHQEPPNPPANQNRNPTVINARLNELSTARATVCAILTVNTPQIIAAIIVLSMHWDDPNVCDKDHTIRWKYWAAMSAFRMFWYSLIVFINHFLKSWLEARPNEQAIMINIKNLVDAFGLIWFIVGNMWLFGDDELGCRHPERSPVYNLCVAMLIINYIQICLPCIVAVMMIPIFCFCMPCLIRVLARLHDPRATQGATEDIISTLPLITISHDHLRQNGDDNSCPICLNELALGEEARVLQCKHLFHKLCVDEWLRVNATCPTCRTSVIAENAATTATNSRTATPNTGSPRPPPSSTATINGETIINPLSANSNPLNANSNRERTNQRVITLNFDTESNNQS
mmetsp:Transcript_28105/g.26961  ORF Transcript_28105/g.26961 Transcript_28105/m.26961 type:complete len:382 (+) Transcript_28105:185-1330(+)